MRGVDEVYNFAADMGGMGFISARKLDCMMSVLINTHLLEAAAHYGRKVKYFFASSACVYPAYRQATSWVPGLKEQEAYPAQPEDGYGWEKLFSERMTRHFAEDFPQISVRIARFHNVYGPWGTYEGGREKAPAALCRKFAEVAAFRTFGSVTQNPERERIEIWGDGKQTRSFLWIADCLDGLSALMHSDWTEPINIGSEQQVSIDQLVDLVEMAAGFSLPRHYCKESPQGVRGRTSDNSLARKVLKWEPCTDLGVGIRATYNWILTRVLERLESKKLNKC
jgi:nucleoside-diphosphate-sugar epimerase